MNHDLKALLELARQAAQAACLAIMQIYQQADFEVESKADQSPLTAADRAAHGIIKAQLAATGLPLLSEEGKHLPYAERQHWQRFWLVDPVDGTKEFIKRNGEFTVNIALIEQQQPVLGVVAVPVSDTLYWGAQGLGAFKESEGQTQALRTRPLPLEQTGLKVVASRSHRDQRTEDFLEGLNQPEIVSMGSSLKFMLLAEGSAQIYPRFAPTMEWDTAAAQAILEIAGGKVEIAGTQEPLVYNKENLLNPYFLAQA